MSAVSVATDRLRMLLACARPMAARLLKLQVRFSTDNGQASQSSVTAAVSLLRDKLKLAVLGGEVDNDHVTFVLSTPYPEPEYLESEVRQSDGVLDVSFEAASNSVDVHRPGEELKAVLNGLRGVGKCVEVHIVDHVTPQDLRERLDVMPAYDILYLVCHGNESGNLLLEDGRGWARCVGNEELAQIVGGKVKVLVVGACHGARSLTGLIESKDGQRPPVIVFAKGEYPIPSRAVQLFSDGFFRSLALGHLSTEAFRKGVDKVRYDDIVGEVTCPDRMLNKDDRPDYMHDVEPSPFKRLQIQEAQTVVFPAITQGEVETRDLRPSFPPHRRIVRADELMMGREVATALLMEELLPPRGGLNEIKNRLINLHGEGGINPPITSLHFTAPTSNPETTYFCAAR